MPTKLHELDLKLHHSLFCERLRLWRHKEGMTQEELGALIGKHSTTIAHWEIGKRKPDFDTLLKLAAVFGVSVDYLLGRR